MTALPILTTNHIICSGIFIASIASKNLRVRHHALSPSVSGACILVVHWRLFARGQDQSPSFSTTANSRHHGRVSSNGRFGPTLVDCVLIQITSMGKSTRIQAEQCRFERA
jgi:hypothetical protein